MMTASEQQTFPKASNGTGLIENLSKHLSNCLAVHHRSFREGETSEVYFIAFCLWP